MSNEYGVNGPKSSSQSVSTQTSGARASRDRLDSDATRISHRKRPNALKHGAFSTNSALPGESPREFQKLHAALINEWQPSGATEDDAVYSLAYLMWRKRRGQKFIEARQNADGAFDARDPAYEGVLNLVIFTMLIDFKPELPLDQCELALTDDQSQHLKERFPRANYRSRSEWVDAIKVEIRTVLMPTALPERDPDDGVNFDVTLRERLDSMIIRQVKNLIQVKAMKQMLRQSSVLREDERPRTITTTSSAHRR